MHKRTDCKGMVQEPWGLVEEIMTLKQAIECAEKRARRYEIQQLFTCANEQKQLAEWLTELRDRRILQRIEERKQ